MQIAGEVDKIAVEIGCTSSQVALNWVRQKNQVMVPIIGARTAAQLAESLGCLDFELTPEQVQRLDAISSIDLGFPHDFLSQDAIRDLIYAGTYSQIKNHRTQ